MEMRQKNGSWRLAEVRIASGPGTPPSFEVACGCGMSHGSTRADETEDWRWPHKKPGTGPCCVSCDTLTPEPPPAKVGGVNLLKLKPEFVVAAPGLWYALVDRIKPDEAVALFRHIDHARMIAATYEGGVMSIVEVQVPA